MLICDEQRHHLLQRLPARTQLLEAIVEAAGLRRAAVVHVLAAAAHAMHLLRHVDDLEPGAERADHLARLGRRPPAGAHDQLDRVFRLAEAAPDRGLPVAFHGIEQRRPALVAQHVADEPAERVHVVAQRCVFQRKENAFAGHGVAAADS